MFDVMDPYAAKLLILFGAMSAFALIGAYFERRGDRRRANHDAQS